MSSTAVVEHNLSLEEHFSTFKSHTIGNDWTFKSIKGNQNLIYADWIASGRLYGPIEDIMRNKIGPMIANPHSFSSETGRASTYAYQYARDIIKEHVNAFESDVLVTTGTGMTAALSKLLRIMGLYKGLNKDQKSDALRPVVFITHMEHHSNQVPWYETQADVVILPVDENNLPDTDKLNSLLEQYAERELKIGSFTACSNVTGTITPYYELAKVMHRHKGICFVDFAASAPYVQINMHPEDPDMHLDAIFFSPHKFLGGPGTCGILLFNNKLYNSNYPDNPGGGNVKCTTPWGEYHYNDSAEVREDGGTPGFLQAIRAALCLQLKDKMGVENIKNREKELLEMCFSEFRKIKGLRILGSAELERIGCVSFTIEEIHYNLIVRLLNDRFGIQVRGGWSCASTYAHHLFTLDRGHSAEVISGILEDNLSNKPGWVRLSLHPTMTNKELLFICNSLKEITHNWKDWQLEYRYNAKNNEFEIIYDDLLIVDVKKWFELS